MNNLNTTVTSAFLSGLEANKSVIKEINPLLIFRRVLGVSESPTARDIVAALQTASSKVGKLQEMQKNFSSPGHIGEIISFDIGPVNVPSWMRFTVLREPLDADDGQTAINFAVIVTDKKEGKRYNRVIGAMSRETNKAGEKQTIFRLIKDICNVEDIEAEVTEQDGVVIPEGAKVQFRKRRGHDDEIIIDSADDDNELFRFADPDVGNIDCSLKYTAKNDIMRSVFKGSVSEIMENFEPIKTKTPEAAPPPPENPVEEQPKEEPPKEEPPAEPIVIHKGELVKFEETSDKVYKAKADLTQSQVNDIVENNKISEFFDEQLPPPPPEVPAPAEDPTLISDEDKKKEAPDLPAVSASAPVGDAPIEVPGESQEVAEPVAPTSQEMVGYDSPAEEQPKEDPDADDQQEEQSAEEAAPAEEPNSETTTKENEQPMSDEIVYHAGDITTFFGDARTWRIKQDVTKSMLQAAKGNMSAFAEVCDEEQPKDEHASEAPAAEETAQPSEEPAPVGDVPEPRKLLSEEHSRGEFLRMLFGTANPNIMHLFSVLKAEANNSTFQATGTWPIEQMIAYPTYSFSIIKMKNGRFYRVFVAHTDKENLNHSTWLETKDVKDRWFELCDIQDREVGRILDMRERR